MVVAAPPSAAAGDGRSRGDRRPPGIALARLDPHGATAVGQVRVDGEIWNARSTEPIDPGAAVIVARSTGSRSRSSRRSRRAW